MSPSDRTQPSRFENPIALGPFQLERPLGHGASGVVWRARHLEEGIPVAVKILTRHYVSQRHFAEEVQSVATLNHPGIATVLDYGRTEPEISKTSNGVLPGDRPYLVMEHADRGTFTELGPEMDWALLKDLMLAVLDALSHAHAHQVIHRDLKPNNVLLTSSADGTLQVKLSDFGLAFRREAYLDPMEDRTEEADSGGTAGTPHFMSPEQLRGRWRYLGPWTDIYGLGCMGWQLSTGNYPFDGPSMMAIARGHLMDGLPEYEPKFPVPERFINWLSRTLQKRPEKRFRTAADAASALLSLGDPEPIDDTGQGLAEASQHSIDSGRIRFRSMKTLHLDDLDDTPTELPDELPDSVPDVGSGRMPAPIRTSAPSVPDDWRLPGSYQPPLALVAAGLELFSLRRLAMAGRVEERDRLWKGLQSAAEDGTPRLAFIHGSAGVGKSRLADWITRRAHEVGAATVLRAFHEPAGAPLDGLRSMLLTFFGVTGLQGEDLRARVRAIVERFVVADDEDDAAVDAIAEPLGLFLDPTVSGEVGGRRPIFQAIDTMLEHLCEERPVVLHLDDLQWGGETLEWASSIVDNKDLPVYVAATYRNEDLSDRPNEARLIDELQDHPASTDMPLVDLKPGELTELLEHSLRLSPALTHEVVDRTDGNPLMAVQMVDDWIARGILDSSDDGFVLAEGHNLEIPENMLQTWQRRLERVLQGFDDEIWDAVAAGSVLGRTARDDDWRAVCERLDLPFPEDAIDALSRANLVRDTGEGWEFAHNMLRQAFERRVRDAGAWSRVNRACAEVFTTEHNLDLPRNQYRAAHFWLAAGEDEEALPLLLDVVNHHGKMGQFDAASYLMERIEEVLDRLDLDEDDSRVLEYHLRAGRMGLTRQELDKAEGHFQVIVEVADDTPSTITAEGLRGLARLATLEGDFGEANELLDRALSEHGQVLSDVTKGSLRRHSGNIAFKLGLEDEAIEELEAAVILHEGEQIEHAKSLTSLGSVQQKSGRLAEAEDTLRSAEEFFSELGSDYGRGRVLSNLGEICFSRGEFKKAFELHGEASRLMTGSVEHRTLCILSKAQAAIKLENLDVSEELLVQAKQLAEDCGSDNLINLEKALRLQLAITRGRADSAHSVVSDIRYSLAQRDSFDRQVVELLREALNDAVAHTSDVELVKSIVQLVAPMYEASGRQAEAEEIRAHLPKTE
jgi:serine/threonine protein kinase/tetratricopeptide (TPR) repeat protein